LQLLFADTKSFKKKYNTGLPAGENKFNLIINEIKDNRKNKKYDCIIGISRGLDPSYLLHLVKKIWHSLYLEENQFFRIFNNVKFSDLC
jgi:hypothetical protein